MALNLEKLVDGFHSAFTDYIDSRSADWFLVSSPLMPISIVVCYLLFVNKLGPIFMANRPPFNVDRFIIVYNIIQILACGYVFVQGTKHWLFENYSLLCQPVDRNVTEVNDQIGNLVYFFYLIKISDLLDTAFFILRKKFNQVSFLHVYHHAGMIFVGYFACIFSLNGHFTLLGVINSFVHVVMYSYYLVTALWPSSKANIWWKKHITTLQLVQFYCLVIHEALPIFQSNCHVQKFWCYTLVIQYSFMIILFTDFYRKAYSSEKKKTL